MGIIILLIIVFVLPFLLLPPEKKTIYQIRNELENNSTLPLKTQIKRLKKLLKVSEDTSYEIYYFFLIRDWENFEEKCRKESTKIY